MIYTHSIQTTIKLQNYVAPSWSSFFLKDDELATVFFRVENWNQQNEYEKQIKSGRFDTKNFIKREQHAGASF